MEVRFLRDGGQTAEDISRQLAGFLAAAQQSLDIAVYDFHLKPPIAAPIVEALAAAAARGVAVRLVYTEDHARAVPVPPPPTAAPDFIHSLGVPVDHLVFVGSYNLSGSGQDNAENVLEIADDSLADRFASFADELRARYPSVNLASATRSVDQRS